MGPAASGIVLAGGRSARFGRDKLAEVIDGRTLLEHAATVVGAVCREVLVVVPPGVDPPRLRDLTGVRHVHDPEPFGGPLVGLLAGLEQAREPIALVVGGDMPGLQPEVLRALLRTLEDADASAAVLRHRGRPQQLPVALRNGAATQVARRLLAADERSLTALLDQLGPRVIDEIDWRGLDPVAATLRDVDRPSDLRRAMEPTGIERRPPDDGRRVGGV
jgi:molybdopterin-guanine dinucleotide biosynthesis protein A